MGVVSVLCLSATVFYVARRVAAEEEALQEAERLAREARRKQEELDAVQREVSRRRAEDAALMDSMAKSAQV